MAIIKPRLNDYHKLPFTQADVDFAIPYLDEDIPLYLDPFLLWRSPSLQDKALHTAMTNSFNHLGFLVNKGDPDQAADSLIRLSECNAVGLGDSKSRIGKLIGRKTADDVLSLFTTIPQVQVSGFVHFEEIQLLVDHIAQDRVSDIACNFISSWLIDYTIQQCNLLGIPREKCQMDVYAYDTHLFVRETVELPVLPTTKSPLLLVPKRWLRLDPWIGYDDYYHRHFPISSSASVAAAGGRIAVLTYNRQNYGVVETYVQEKERTQADCHNDPLFSPIPVFSVRRKLSTIQKLSSGTQDAADKKYEDAICQLMASLLYPQLDFAAEQSRVDSGVLIRDLIFYNNRSYDFLRDIYDEYDCRQMVVELKNVKEIEREHINQINRYLKDQFGRFGIIITRNPPSKQMFRNTIDLWAGQRRCILILDDSDAAMMCQLYESKQRLPIDVIKKKYVEFTRACPG